MASIVELHVVDPALHEQASALLVEGFRDMWPDLESARAGVDAALAAVEDGSVVGWVGGIASYDGNVWELHPLVVQRDRRGRGIGSALVRALE